MSTKSLVNCVNWRCLVGMEVAFLGYTQKFLATTFRKDFVFIKSLMFLTLIVLLVHSKLHSEGKKEN
jgi:hypothetical protein